MIYKKGFQGRSILIWMNSSPHIINKQFCQFYGSSIKSHSLSEIFSSFEHEYLFCVNFMLFEYLESIKRDFFVSEVFLTLNFLEHEFLIELFLNLHIFALIEISVAQSVLVDLIHNFSCHWLYCQVNKSTKQFY